MMTIWAVAVAVTAEGADRDGDGAELTVAGVAGNGSCWSVLNFEWLVWFASDRQIEPDF